MPRQRSPPRAPARTGARGGSAPRSTARVAVVAAPASCGRPHATTSLGSRRTTSSAMRAGARAVRDRAARRRRHPPARAPRATGRPRCRGRARRSARRARRRGAAAEVPVERAGDGDALRLSAREPAPCTPSSRSGSMSSAHASASARATSAGVGARVAERDVVAHGPGDEPGLLARPREPGRRGRGRATSRPPRVAAPVEVGARRAGRRRRWTCRRRSVPRGA